LTIVVTSPAEFTVIPVTATGESVTITAHVAVKPPSTVVTVIVVVPAVNGVTTPLATVATAGALEDHVTFYW
jgi:hypothetical protein